MNLNARTPYRAAFAAMTLVLLVACSAGQGPKIEVDAGAKEKTTLEAAMQADKDFAAMSKKDGLKAAFLQYTDAKDGAFIQPGLVVTGAEKIAAGFDGSPPGFSIDWGPDGGHGSTGGDLAVTTGRYTISTGAQPIEQGRYVTVWRKDAAGALKAVMQLNVGDAPPPAVQPGAKPIVAPTPDKPDFEGRPG